MIIVCVVAVCLQAHSDNQENTSVYGQESNTDT